jgi:hypothetical protein
MKTDPVSETLCSSVFLKYWMMDKVQKPNSPECHIPSSEPFKVYMFHLFSNPLVVLPFYYEPLTLPEGVVWGFFRCFTCADSICHDIKTCQTMCQGFVTSSEVAD